MTKGTTLSGVPFFMSWDVLVRLIQTRAGSPVQQIAQAVGQPGLLGKIHDVESRLRKRLDPHLPRKTIGPRPEGNDNAGHACHVGPIFKSLDHSGSPQICLTTLGAEDDPVLGQEFGDSCANLR